MELNLEEDFQKIIVLAQALSNENRLNILLALKNTDDSSHKDLANRLDVRHSSISFHISQLIDAELVEEETTKGLKGRNRKTPKLTTNKIVINL